MESAAAHMYNYRSYSFDFGEYKLKNMLSDGTLIAVFADFYYVDDIDYGREAYGTLSENVSRGMTPIEAYQEKLLAEKDNLLRMARESHVSARKSVGSLGGDGFASDRDEFLEGFSMYD